MLAPAISLVSYLRINLDPALSVKLFLCEHKVCGSTPPVYPLSSFPRSVGCCLAQSITVNFWICLSAVPTEEPTAITTLPILDPPMLLSANLTEQGVLLQWSPPEAPSSPLTGYVLQARRDQGQWVILSSNISASRSELLVQGLLRVNTALCLI